MRLILHIFKKDVRRLWWGIAIALLLQIAVAWFDARGGVEPLELSLLLVLTWACLIALAVHEDPLVGDRQFWITRPGRWRVLLGSKLLFAAVAIHLPWFVACVVLLAARGFRPWEWLPSLLEKQLSIAMALTLPVFALAAVLRSFAYLALAAIAIGGLTDFAVNFTPTLYLRWKGVEDTRLVLFAVVLAIGAGAIVIWQFARRRNWPARFVGVAAVVVAELVLAVLSPVFIARVRAVFHPIHTEVAFHLGPPAESTFDQSFGIAQRYSVLEWATLRLPLIVPGIPPGFASFYDLPPLDVVAPGNVRYLVRPAYLGSDSLILPIRRELYERLKNVQVELKGAVATIVFSAGTPASISVGANRAVPGVGRCSSSVVDHQGFDFTGNGRSEHRFVQVLCESPDGFPLPSFVRFWPAPPSTAGVRTEELGWNYTVPPLSPIERSVGSFSLAPGEDPRSSGELMFTPDILKGWQVVNLDFRGIRLSDYVVR